MNEIYNAMEQKTATSYLTDFSEFYQKYRELVLTFIISRIPHKYEAEDLTQDVFIRLWENWAFVNKSTVWSLLFTIARNVIIDRIRHHYIREDFTSYIYNNVEKNDRNTIEEQLYYQELKERHEMIVHALPARRRRIYELSFNKELSCPVIAGIMSLSSRTVEGQLLVARKTVRACLRNELNKVG